MNLYRIARTQYADDLSGRGGLLSAARWHHHMPVIYTSLHSSTCILEKLVHLRENEIHNDLRFIEMIVPDDSSYQVVDPGELPASWTRYPAPKILADIGNMWLQSKSALLLEVPSVVDTLAKNVLINPLHPEAENITIASTRPFVFDRRIIP